MNWTKELKELKANELSIAKDMILQSHHTKDENCSICLAHDNIKIVMVESKWPINICNKILEHFKYAEVAMYECFLQGFIYGYCLGRQFSEVEELEKLCQK